MKITEEQTSYGTLFIVEHKPTEQRQGVTIWLRQNDIQHIYDHRTNYMDHYFIRDEAGIMAFKLRWM